MKYFVISFFLFFLLIIVSAGQIHANEKDLTIGGVFRLNYAYRDHSSVSKEKGGEFNFEMFGLNVDATLNDFIVSVQYRWYDNIDALEHGWLGYNLNDNWQLQLGLTKAPFGLLPFAAHSFWLSLGYYIGLEEDYDVGIKIAGKEGPWDLQLAFFKNGDTALDTDASSYTFDIVRDDAQGQFNEESNQGNAYTMEHGGLGDTEIGISGRWGQLFNTSTGRMGDHYAYAAHLNGFYGPFHLMLEAARYKYDPENPSEIDSRSIFMGGLGAHSLSRPRVLCI